MRLLVVLMAALSLVSVSHVSARANDPNIPLVELARVGPWPAISRLIGFDGRLWFANSVKYRNHNSADIYSFEPAGRNLRYETHLFSQDAGRPTVAHGRLYWPFEDARFSTGRAEFMATDGTSWDWRTIPEWEAFHAHAMRAEGGALFAATSSWKGRILHSADQGATWRQVYEHGNTEGVSRITTLGALKGTLYAGMTARRETGPKLLRGDATGFQPVPGWPDGQRVDALATFGAHLYASNQQGDDLALYRTDGATVERLETLDGRRIRAIAANEGQIVAVSGADGQGHLWQSYDGSDWLAVQHFADAQPVDVALFEGQIYVGAMGADGNGVLFGPAHPTRGAPNGTVAKALPLPPDRIAAEDIPDAFARLDAALADPASFGHQLPSLFEDLAANRSPVVGEGFAARLNGEFPDRMVPLFGGAVEVPAAVIGRWALLNAIARNGHGEIASAFLREDWQAEPNRAEKYLAPAPAATWAVTRTGQRDVSMLDALISRLGRAADPAWLKGDVVGALSALTGRRFGYDVVAWRKWWAARQPD